MITTIKVKDAKKGDWVTIGKYDTDTKTLHKTVGKFHKCWKYKGYGIQTEGIQELKDSGCECIVIHTFDSKLESPLSAWFGEFAVEDNLGHGDQIFLPDIHMVNMTDTEIPQ